MSLCASNTSAKSSTVRRKKILIIDAIVDTIAYSNSTDNGSTSDNSTNQFLSHDTIQTISHHSIQSLLLLAEKNANIEYEFDDVYIDLSFSSILQYRDNCLRSSRLHAQHHHDAIHSEMRESGSESGPDLDCGSGSEWINESEHEHQTTSLFPTLTTLMLPTLQEPNEQGEEEDADNNQEDMQEDKDETLLNACTLHLLDVFIQIIFPYLLNQLKRYSLGGNPRNKVDNGKLVYVQYECKCKCSTDTTESSHFLSLFQASVAAVLLSMQLELEVKQQAEATQTIVNPSIQVLRINQCSCRMSVPCGRHNGSASPLVESHLQLLRQDCTGQIGCELELRCISGSSRSTTDCSVGAQGGEQYFVHRYRSPVLIDDAPTLLATPAASPISFVESAVKLPALPRAVIITGGLGGIGLTTASVLEQLVLSAAPLSLHRHSVSPLHIVLVTSRAPELDPVTGHKIFSVANAGQAMEAELERLLATDGLSSNGQREVHVHAMTCDVSRASEVQILWRQVAGGNWDQAHELAKDTKDTIAIVGVIHSAGVLVTDAPLKDIETAAVPMAQNPNVSNAVERVWGAKATGAWNIHCCLHAHTNLPPPFFICYSSIASTVGNPGYSSYCAANEFISELMLLRNASAEPDSVSMQSCSGSERHKTHACAVTNNWSIHWPPIAGVGMAAAAKTDTPAFSMNQECVRGTIAAVLTAMPQLQLMNKGSMNSTVVALTAGTDSGIVVLMPALFTSMLTTKSTSVRKETAVMAEEAETDRESEGEEEKADEEEEMFLHRIGSQLQKP